jgi:pimeloyl-ACP methyl ester carboxylesterase
MNETISRYVESGRCFTASGVGSFVLDEGQGEPVVCMHGVPASAFLYRKVVPALAAHGLRGIAFDLPGLGLAARPADFDYSWTGLGRWSASAVDALGLDRFHLVVHDIGGPVGFEVAARMPERIASLTVLNTIIAADHFHRPWVMKPFATRGIGELWLASLNKPMFRTLMKMQGVADPSAVPVEELDAYVDLLKRNDRGAAFLKIMRGFERTREKQDLYERVVSSDRYPVQVVWGEQDPALPLKTHGEHARKIAGLDRVITLPGKHLLQEDCAEQLADHIADLCKAA